MSTASPLPPKQFTIVEGHRLAHVEMGRGDPIVLLHGNPTSSDRWRDVMPPLASRGRVIAPDRRWPTVSRHPRLRIRRPEAADQTKATYWAEGTNPQGCNVAEGYGWTAAVPG